MDNIQIQRKIIFVVDDDQAVLSFVQVVLDKMEMTPRSFLNGELLLDAIETHLPDLILLDIDMPSGMDGFEVCQKLKANEEFKEIPIIFLSGAADIQNKVKGFDMGAVDFIPKPVLPGELIARVKTQLTNAQLKKDLKASEKKYRQMMESIVDPVYIVSAEGLVEYMNPAMVKRVGKDGVGQPCHKMVHDTDEPCDWCCLDRVKAGQSVENHFVSPKDDRRFHATHMPIHHENGTMSKMTIMRDVTDFWQALEEKKKAEHQLMQAQKMESIGQLASGIAHEINTPIQYVLDNTGFLETAFSDILPALLLAQELLNKRQSGSTIEDIIEKVETALDNADLEYHCEEIPLAIQQSLEGARRVAKIVRSMKEFSNPGGKEVEADINQAIKNTITISRNEWKYMSTLTCDLDESLPRVFCNPGEINQVLLNMVINAANAIEGVVGKKPESKGQIHIQTLHTDEWVQIRIKDTGIGIPKDEKHKIFDPFFTTKEVGKGSGQGLAIAYAIIVEKHKGKIDCESEPGTGSLFTISQNPPPNFYRPL